MGIKASIIICSLNRDKVLQRCLDSLKKQTCQDYEIVLCQEEGNLVELKDRGWRKAKGEIIIFIDDDIECDENWLKNILENFERDEWIVGVTGPTFVPPNYLKNRDIFKDGWFKKFYNRFFLENKQYFPGLITKCGANTYGANFDLTYVNYSQFVDFLEPSQFAVRKWIMEKVNGFDLKYTGVAEWCDVDLCYRIKKYGFLFFDPKIKVTHYPEKDTIYNKRLDTASRYQNYLRFAKKWVKPGFKHYLYRLFIKSYFYAKGKKWI